MTRDGRPSLRLLLRAGLARNIGYLVAGSGLSQAALLVATPFILILYGAKAFGLHATILAAASVLSGLTTLRIDAVVPFIAARHRALRLVAAVIGIILAMTILEYAVIGVSYLCCGGVVHWFGDITGFVILWVPLIVLGQTLMVACRAWAARSSAFRQSTVAQVTRTAVFLAGAFGLGWLLGDSTPFAAKGLLIAQLCGDLVSSVIIVVGMRRTQRRLMLPWPVHRPWREMKAHHAFIGAASISNLLAMLNHSIPVWTIGAVFGLQAAGWFSAAQRIVAAPVQFTIDTVGVAFNQRVRGRLARGEPVLRDILRLSLALTCLLAPVFVALAWLAQGERLRFLGGDWAGAGSTLSAMVLIAFGSILYTAVEGVPLLFRLNTFLVGYHATRFALMLTLTALAAVNAVTYNTWIFLYALAEMLLYGGNATLLLVHLRRRETTALS
jgi:O-antigen/teichoic acid export membrane protein